MAEGESKCPCIIRVINIITALLLIGFGLAGLIVMIIANLISAKFFLVFSPIFMIIFGIVILAAEFKCEFFLKHLSFLRSLLGRGIFNIYLSSSVFYFFSCGSAANTEIVGWIAGILIFCIGVFYIFMHFCGGDKVNAKSDTQREMNT